MNSKYSLLKIKPRYNTIIILSILLFLLIIVFSVCYQTYDSFKITGIYQNSHITITLLAKDTKNIVNSDFLKIKDQKCKFSIESISEPEYEILSDNSYQTIILNVSNVYINNEILELSFYKNKQRIIFKFFNLLK